MEISIGSLFLTLNDWAILEAGKTGGGGGDDVPSRSRPSIMQWAQQLPRMYFLMKSTTMHNEISINQ